MLFSPILYIHRADQIGHALFTWEKGEEEENRNGQNTDTTMYKVFDHDNCDSDSDQDRKSVV